MPKICLSYRRSDSAAIAGRIYDRLVARYGPGLVFMDIDNVPYGADFRKHVQNAFSGADVIFVVIGREWLGRGDSGRSRIQDATDPVRVEVQIALREGLRIVPILVDGASMPRHDDLPKAIEALSYRNAIHVDSGRDFNVHVDRLIKFIDRGSDDTVVAAGASAGGKLGSFEAMSYFGAMTASLLLAHYAIIIKLDLNPIYLRFATAIVSLLCGILLFLRSRRGPVVAFLLGLSSGFVAVAGMLTTVGIIDARPIVSLTPAEWQEAIEYFGTIVLATVAGNLLGRVFGGKLL